MTKNVILEIKNLKKSYGQNQVLKDISISVEKGEVISIIGSSGSGNQPSSDLSTFWKHQQKDRFYTTDKMFWLKDMI